MKKNAQKKPKHKPNARHTLNEVLHSLQDMMHNELAGIDDEESGDKPGTARSKEEALNALKALIGTPGDPQSTNPADADKAMQIPPVGDASGEDKITTDVALQSDPAVEQPTEDSATGDFVQDEEIVLEEIPEPPPEQELAEENISDDAIKTDEIESVGTPAETGRSDDGDKSLPADDFKLEMEDTRRPEVNTPPKATAKTRKKSQKGKDKAPGMNAGKQVEIGWDDIPVLNEVVAPPPAPDDATTREARAIAAKVAAALNIETREKGGKAMDIKAVMRLQSLLSQELKERQNEDSGDEADEDDENQD